MTKSLLVAAVVTLAATSAWAQSDGRGGAAGSTGVNDVSTPPAAAPVAPASASNASNGNPGIDRSGAGGSTGGNVVGTNFAATSADANANVVHPSVATVPMHDNAAGLGDGGSTTWRGPYRTR